ncbi:MAG: hypothetical protein H8K03_11185 [Nitrospira sp.]
MEHFSALSRTKRVNDLVREFEIYCDEFDNAGLFSGPSVYFHNKTISLLRKYQSPCQVLQDKEFYESLYATLASWGLHRMGPGKTKLVNFDQMVNILQGLESDIRHLETLQIWNLNSERLQAVAEQIWSLIARLKIGIGQTRIVSGSKALHHLIPELVPPMDREYTLKFFFNHKNLNKSGEDAFREMYPHFHRIAVSCRERIEARLGKGMYTSFTKVIDNAIVGYVVKHLKQSMHPEYSP